MRAQPLIAVADVEASSTWYQQVLGCRSGHGGSHYEQLVSGDDLILQLHDWDQDVAHEPIGDPSDRPYGNGVLLWFETDDFDASVVRARDVGAEVVLEPQLNPNARHREVWVRDPDGYTVVVASCYGDDGATPGS